MITRGFYEVTDNEKDPWWFSKKINDLDSLVKPSDYNFIEADKTIADCLSLMREKNVDCLLALENGY